MTGEIKLSAIGQVALQVDDLDAAAEFYGAKLGLPLVARFPGLAFLDCAGVRLMLSSLSEAASTGNSVLYFNVPEIKAAYETLRSRGVEFTHEPHVIHSADNYELWMAFFEDPDGNTMGIMDERGSLTG